MIAAMQKADSTDPAKYLPELQKISYNGATGKIEFDEKGDRKNAEITIFTLKDGKVVPVGVVKAGKASSFEDFMKAMKASAAAANPAPAAAPRRHRPRRPRSKRAQVRHCQDGVPRGAVFFSRGQRDAKSGTTDAREPSGMPARSRSVPPDARVINSADCKHHACRASRVRPTIAGVTTDGQRSFWISSCSSWSTG